MQVSELPPYYLPLFGAAFVANAAYLGCLFGLRFKLSAQGNDEIAAGMKSGDLSDVFKVLGFVFSGRHADHEDPMISQLTWGTRVFLIVGGVLTLTAFAVFLGSI